MLNWTEKELAECLAKNPALRVNPKYSVPEKSAKDDVKRSIPKRTRIILPPMKFYEYEEPIRFILPFVYPSLNKTLRMNRWKRKRQEDEFRDAVRWYLMLYKIRGFRSKIILEVKVSMPVLRHRDTDNYCYKWLKDAIKGIVIIDDDPRYVVEKPVVFEKGKLKMEVRITPIKGVNENADSNRYYRRRTETMGRGI